MDIIEIVAQLTSKAMELGVIAFDTSSCDSNEKIEEQNAFNAKQISDFCIAISQSLLPNEE